VKLIEKIAYEGGKGPKFKVLRKGQVKLDPGERALTEGGMYVEEISKYGLG